MFFWEILTEENRMNRKIELFQESYIIFHEDLLLTYLENLSYIVKKVEKKIKFHSRLDKNDKKVQN